MTYITLIIGFALIFYGLSPLAGSGIGNGISERGCIAALFGIALISIASIVSVLA